MNYITNFSHTIIYSNNEFQHINLNFTLDDGRTYAIKGIEELYHTTSRGTFKTPMAVFTALEECRVNKTAIDIKIDEPRMFCIEIEMNTSYDYFHFNAHTYQQIARTPQMMCSRG